MHLIEMHVKGGFNNHGNFPLRGVGGYPPFPLTFRQRTVREGGRGYPLFPLRKNPSKIGLKTVFFGQNMPFSVTNFRFQQRTVKGGGGYPPFR